MDARRRRALVVILAGESGHVTNMLRRGGANEATERCGGAASDTVLTDMFSRQDSIRARSDRRRPTPPLPCAAT